MTQPKQPSTLETMTTARDYWYGQAIHLEAELAKRDATLSAQSVRVAIECIESERSATQNMMDGWKETSDKYKRYAAEVVEYDAALAELATLTQRTSAQGEG